MAVLNTGDVVICPCCGISQVDVVEDFVVPGYIGKDSQREHNCDDCDRNFIVVRTAEDEYNVSSV